MLMNQKKIFGEISCKIKARPFLVLFFLVKNPSSQIKVVFRKSQQSWKLQFVFFLKRLKKMFMVIHNVPQPNFFNS